MKQTSFKLERPDVLNTFVVFASPHSGRNYPKSLLNSSQLQRNQLRSSEDAFVDRLFSSVPGFGAPLLSALAPRAYVDLNRNSDELDPALINGVRLSRPNPRINSGLGVIPRVVAEGRVIHTGKISLEAAQQRLREVYVPYHQQLSALLAESHRQFGQSLLIDCHSMPHEALVGTTRPGEAIPDVVLGDRHGRSCSSFLMDQVEEILTTEGFTVSRNSPFAGAYIAQQYGKPAQHQHVIQLEIDRCLYLDENRVRPGPGYQTVKLRLDRVAQRICQLGQARKNLAAE